MAIVYTTVIRLVRVTTQDDLTDVIKEVEVEVTGQDGACKFSLPAVVKFGPADPDDFTDFSDLTEAEVVAWVEADPSLEPVKAHIAYVVAQEVEKAALEQKPLPWAPEPAPAPTPEA